MVNNKENSVTISNGYSEMRYYLHNNELQAEMLATGTHITPSKITERNQRAIQQLLDNGAAVIHIGTLTITRRESP